MNDKIRQEAMHIHNWCEGQCDCAHCDFGRDNRTCKISGIPAQWFDDDERPANTGKTIKTRQERFLEMFPRMAMCGDVLDLCPGRLGEQSRCPNHYDCRECKRDYWFAKEDENV